MDDAGNTGENLKDPQQPRHYVGALIVPEDRWAETQARVAQVEIFSRQNGYQAKAFELHGAPLFGGNAAWKNVDYPNRIEILNRCLRIIEDLDLNLVVGCCDKTKLTRYRYPDHPHLVALWLCVERIARYGRLRQSLSIMIADECSVSMKTISKKFLRDYREKGPPFGLAIDLSSIIDTVHFMDSRESCHIQLCDLSLFCLRRWEATSDPRIRDFAVRIINRTPLRHTFPY